MTKTKIDAPIIATSLPAVVYKIFLLGVPSIVIPDSDLRNRSRGQGTARQKQPIPRRVGGGQRSGFAVLLGKFVEDGQGGVLPIGVGQVRRSREHQWPDLLLRR